MPENEKKVDDELSNLENAVETALGELSELDDKFADIVKSTSDLSGKEGKMLLAARRLQNSMTVMIYVGAKKRDLETFNEGFNFYNNAIAMLASSGNRAEIDQTKNEFAQVLLKVLTLSDAEEDEEFRPFLAKACQMLAEIYDSFKMYDTGLQFHIQAGNLLADNPIQNEFEYLKVLFAYILLGQEDNAKNISEGLNIKHIKSMASEVIEGLANKNIDIFDKVRNKIEVLGAQRRLDTANILSLLGKIKTSLLEMTKTPIPTAIEIPDETVPLSQDKVNEIQISLSQGIQQLQEKYPNIQIPISATIDTTSIISELKDVISSEISKEIKSLSSEIVSKILSNLPSGGIASAPRARSGGAISDDAIPDIEVVAGAPGEKPKRPKLDDMLDSIIVSE